MSASDNKAIARRHFEEFWASGNLAVADEIYATGAVGHALDGTRQGGYPECEKQTVVRNRTAFPDTRITVEDQIAEGDKVVTRWTAQATHVGEFVGIAPTGKRVTVRGAHVHRIMDGKIVEIWSYPDVFGLLQQLGAIPSLGK